MLGIARTLGRPAVSRVLFGRIHRTIGRDLECLISGGSRFDEQVARDLHALGYTVIQAYGLTETTAGATVTPVRDNSVGTVGKPIRGVGIRIEAPDGTGVGEVCVSGPILMQGYHRDPGATREVLRNGWLHTGDLGFIDTAGNLRITGRSKDVIVLANGENVYPEEVEARYLQCPLIKEICIIGVPETDHDVPVGEKLQAVVVPDLDEFRKRGQTAIVETVRFEMENLSKQLPSYQRAHALAVRNEPFPRTATRKLKRFEIYEQERVRAGEPPLSRLAADHARLAAGMGATVAELIREARPDVGFLDPGMNLELDLGFDSLGRVELMGRY